VPSPRRDRHGAPERAVADTRKTGASCWSTIARLSYERLAPMLATEHTVDVESDPSRALFHAAEGNTIC
jgi:two-component system cell cycle response regulator